MIYAFLCTQLASGRVPDDKRRMFDLSSLVYCPRAGSWLPTPQLSWFSAFLFISPYVSSNTSSIMPILGLPVGLFPSILPSSTNSIRPSPLTTCPIQFFFLSHIVFIKLPFSFMEPSICSFVLLSIQLTIPILLHTHISKAFKRFISSFLMVHVSHLYRTTGHTSVLTNLFFRSTVILLVSSSFLLLNASFSIPILVLTSSKHLPSSEINEPKYQNLVTCSTL